MYAKDCGRDDVYDRGGDVVNVYIMTYNLGTQQAWRTLVVAAKYVQGYRSNGTVVT
jgi:hypothetical protein